MTLRDVTVYFCPSSVDTGSSTDCRDAISFRFMDLERWALRPELAPPLKQLLSNGRRREAGGRGERQHGGNLPIALAPVRSPHAAGACCFSSREEWPLRCLYAAATRYARQLAKRCRRICADGNCPSAEY
ncbi:unnamed protein product [Chrysodeixis includens]|uniref:Uncharacterized protein n=1 Tax=Chrysodeixis includens TaxID=689277 RepID=A0A9N8KWS1_CHRIL|nr:unnamed protein product [Chrysodeixis includens]